ncbi:MAG: hypothetical protein AAGK09_00265 [Planctomycetota bacterium]
MNQWMQMIFQNIGAVIFVLLIVGSIVANIVRASQKANQEGSSEEEGSQPSRPEDLAARRRAEMSGRGVSARTGGGDPSNMTMAERIARARAKAQYEQRSADLTRGVGRTPAEEVEVELVETGDRSDAFEQAEQRRREQAAAMEQRREAERRQAEMAEQRRRQQQAEVARREARERRQAEQARAQQQSQQSPSRQQGRQASQPRQGQQFQRPSRRRRPSAIENDGSATDAIRQGEVGTGKTAPGMAGTSTGSGGKASVFGVRLTRRTMRHAIVLREILDPPVSLRESGTGVATGASRG